jgi:hypothetical protein
LLCDVSLAPDILDALGKTPREFGGLHVHFEAVRRVDGRRVVAVLLVQAAFLPLPRGGEATFRVGAHTLARGPLPLPRGTEVLRVTWPLLLPADVPRVLLELELPPPQEGARRIRTAWKLQDTLEIPKLSEMELAAVPRVPELPAAMLVSVLIGDGLAFADGAPTEPRPRTTIHRAPALPPLELPIEGTSRPVESVHVETVWEEGQPVPEAPLILKGQEPSAPAQAVRRCRACGWEGPADEVERLRTCPSCDALWG